MKLRKYHESMSWPVPIECDAEYGRSWDVDWSINKVGYTYIDGLETYVPDAFSTTTVNNLYKFIASGDEERREKAKGYLQQALHPRAFESAKYLFKAQDRKEIQKQLVAALQLHEYWSIDHVPDGDEGDRSLETLAEYEQRMGISARDPLCPEFGYMGPIPLDNPNVIRPEPNLLGDAPIGESTATEIKSEPPIVQEKAMQEVEEIDIPKVEPRGSVESIARARSKPGHTYCSGKKFKRSDMIAEANARHEVHEGQASSRPLSTDYELLGLAGEVQGEADFGLTRDSRILAEGDGRIDFFFPDGKSGDWKVARKAYNLLMEEKKPHADILIAGLWCENGEFCWVEWMGWEYRDELLKVRPKDFGYGVINHYRAVDNLRPMSEFPALAKLRSSTVGA
jgi:hypothetical protein